MSRDLNLIMRRQDALFEGLIEAMATDGDVTIPQASTVRPYHEVSAELKRLRVAARAVLDTDRPYVREKVCVAALAQLRAALSGGKNSMGGQEDE